MAWSSTPTVVRATRRHRAFAAGTTFVDKQRPVGNQMTRKQLEQQRERVETQMRWAAVHDGDQELLDLLRLESDRLLR
jgi:hypothetical protein